MLVGSIHALPVGKHQIPSTFDDGPVEMRRCGEILAGLSNA